MDTIFYVLSTHVVPTRDIVNRLPDARTWNNRAYVLKALTMQPLVIISGQLLEVPDGVLTIANGTDVPPWAWFYSDGVRWYLIAQYASGTGGGGGGGGLTPSLFTPTGPVPGNVFDVGAVYLPATHDVFLNSLRLTLVDSGPDVSEYTLVGTTLTTGVTVEPGDSFIFRGWS